MTSLAHSLTHSLTQTPGLRSERQKATMLPCWMASHVPANQQNNRRPLSLAWSTDKKPVLVDRTAAYIREQRPLEDRQTIDRRLIWGFDRSSGMQGGVGGKYAKLFGSQSGRQRTAAHVRVRRRRVLQHVSRICGRLKDGRGGWALSQGHCKVLRRIANNTNIPKQTQTERRTREAESEERRFLI